MANEVWAEYRKKIVDSISDFSIIYGNNSRPSNKPWMRRLCPFHREETPSFGWRTDNGNFGCLGCHIKGSFIDFLALTSGLSFKETLLQLGDQLGIPRPEFKPERPPIDEKLIQQWQSDLTPELKVYLHKERGLYDKTIEENEIGYCNHDKRYTIPIRDENKELVNIRKYTPSKDAPVGKMINHVTGKKGEFKYGSPARIYGLYELIKSDRKQVIICEGEWDVLVARQEEFLAVTGTHGAGTFRPEWIPFFKDKDVVVIYDCDKPGIEAANNIVAKAFKGSEIASLKVVKLPLRGTPDDKDITDYFVKRKQTRIDLQNIIDNTPVYEWEDKTPKEEIFLIDSFIKVDEKEYIDKKISCEITLCGETDESFHAVEKFQVAYCSKMAQGKCYDCKDPIDIPYGSREYIGSCMSSDQQVIAMLRNFCCKYGQKPTIEILQRTPIREFFCHQKINRMSHLKDENGQIIQLLNGQRQEIVEKKVYSLSTEILKPSNYSITGWVKTHPKTQQITLLIDTMKIQDEDYQSFKLDDNLNLLIEYQKLSLDDIVSDLINITRIYGRDEILLAIILTYCSPLWINFNNEIINGWLNISIIGDAGTGKTQSYQRISEFINIGDCFSGLTGSRTGLVYALVEHSQKGWQIKIGRYPANSGKILCIDESQFVNELRTMSKAMEEGYVQVDKVRSKGYDCKTRLILLANPKGDIDLDSYSFGCEAIKDLFVSPIVRRLDFALLANTSDISPENFTVKYNDKYRKKITSNMLRAVVYWIWNLKSDQVIFEKDAEQFCLDGARSLNSVYGHAGDIPVVITSDQHKKLARISTAFAGMLLSTDESFSKLIIKKDHVELAISFLNSIYSANNCQLNDYADIHRQYTQILDYDAIETSFIKKIDFEKHNPLKRKTSILVHILHILRTNKTVRRDDLTEQVGCGKTTITEYINLLKRFSLIESTKDGYQKKPKFNKFLRKFIEKHPIYIFRNEDIDVENDEVLENNNSSDDYFD